MTLVKRYTISIGNDELALEPNDEWDIEPTSEALATFGEDACYVGRTLDQLDEAWRLSAAEEPDVPVDDITRHKVRKLIREQRAKDAKFSGAK